MPGWNETSPQAQDYIKNGFITPKLSGRPALDGVRNQLVLALKRQLPGGQGLTDEEYLNRFHEHCDASKVNEVRVRVYRELGASDSFRKQVYECIKAPLIELIGPEIVMQRLVNLVIQMPNDPAGLIALHTDAWAGDSPYEVVLWLPLVDVYESKSMYLCSKEKNHAHLLALKGGLKLDSAAALRDLVRPDSSPVQLKYGDALLFSPILLHGAEENLTRETRFVLNVRFKSLFSPYGTKALGETFLPISYLPATEVGLNYEAEFGIVGG